MGAIMPMGFIIMEGFIMPMPIGAIIMVIGIIMPIGFIIMEGFIMPMPIGAIIMVIGIIMPIGFIMLSNWASALADASAAEARTSLLMCMVRVSGLSGFPRNWGRI
jgi:hypothetical protein